MKDDEGWKQTHGMKYRFKIRKQQIEIAEKEMKKMTGNNEFKKTKQIVRYRNKNKQWFNVINAF